MRRITSLIVFAFTLTVGTSAWYILAQKRPDPEGAGQIVSVTTVMPSPAQSALGHGEGAKDLPEQSIKFGPVEPTYGYASVKTIVLRERPERDAPVVARLKIGDYDSAQILGSTRDYLHVRFAASDGSGGNAARDRDYEGWTDWRSVTPTMSAIVLDAETGAVVAHLPLSYLLASVAYSPDGSRAMLFSGYGDGTVGCEVQTSDYKLTRCLTSNNQSSNNIIFYGPADNALYAAVMFRGGSNPSKLKIIRIGEDGALNTPTGISAEAEDFAISPDGLTGFILHGSSNSEMRVDVVDLRTFAVRNSFTLVGDELPSTVMSFVTNRDGTELYARLNHETNSVHVIDTRTGAPLRVMPLDVGAKESWYIDRGGLIGDSLLINIWDQDAGEMQKPHAIWLEGGGRKAAEKEISFAVQAGDARYAINDSGTTLFKLDSNNRIRARLPIERPELLYKTAEEQGLGVFGLSASPDGKRLIMFVGVEDGC